MLARRSFYRGSLSSRLVFILFICLPALEFIACNNGGSGTGVSTARQAVNSSTGTKAIGESCGSQADCLPPEVCFHYFSGVNAWVCSASGCNTDADCPDGWGCAEIVPGYKAPDGRVCSPPSSWVPQATAVPPGSSTIVPTGSGGGAQ